MTVKEILLLIVAIGITVGIPALMIWGVVDHVRHGHKRERKGGGGGAAPLGSALMELDRLVARPSVEHVVEAENKVVRREDDQGGRVAGVAAPSAPPGPVPSYAANFAGIFFRFRR
jgi:hypothetical protein